VSRHRLGSPGGGPVDRRDAVGEPDESGSSRSGASDSVIAHLDVERAVSGPCRDLRVTCVRVLGDVCQRFGDDEVCGRLDGWGEPVDRDAGLDRHGHPRRERAHSGAQPAASEDRGEDAVRELAQLAGGLLSVLERLRDQRRGLAGFLLQSPGRHLQRDDGVDEALLSAVVKVPNDPPALVVRGGDDARARGGQVRAGLGVGDRRCDELGELTEPQLDADRDRL
jgi:hypothetical protein